MRKLYAKVMLLLFALLLAFPLLNTAADAATKTKQRIYDDADLLTAAEMENLEALASKYSTKRKTDIVIITTNSTDGKDMKEYVEDFYDEKALGYDKAHGNTVILAINMQERDVELQGYKEAEHTLDNSRVNLIREKITPALSNGDYEAAFESYIKTAYQYMGVKKGVDPNNLLFNTWFQMIASIGLAGIIVGVMAYNSGGKVTVSGDTYRDANSSKVKQRRDTYIRTSVSKRKKPTDNGGGSGGGGGGVSKGGHSHSGSSGKF